MCVEGARTHNLRNVSVEIPHNTLTVLTGVSGSGKSSLAFDTIYAEGQRQYIESLSTYARQFLNQLERADVDSITGLQPTLCIDQRVAIANPRSTVATITEIYDFVRLLYAKLGIPECFECGETINRQSSQTIVRKLRAMEHGTKLIVLAPMVRGRKGRHREVIEQIRKSGLVRVRVDGETYEVGEVPELSLRKNHTIEAVVDKIIIRGEEEERLAEAVELALKLADGLVIASTKAPGDVDEWSDELFSTRYSCVACGANFEEIEPRTFSFNSPYGACPECDGIGLTNEFSIDAVFPESLGANFRISDIPLIADANRSTTKTLTKELSRRCEAIGLGIDQPLQARTKSQRKRLFYGGGETEGGINAALLDIYEHADEAIQGWLDKYSDDTTCDACQGSRLRIEALSVRVAGLTIHDCVKMSLSEFLGWIETLEFPEEQQSISQPIIAELLHRSKFLNQVGVGYLTLERAADTLSGGELQRVRLATCVGNGLVGVTYILDEPSIGLHQRDNDRLISSMRRLQEAGNTVLVVEHDEAMMRAADRVYDLGPGAGSQGGEIVAVGTAGEIEACQQSLTGQYLLGNRTVRERDTRRSARSGNKLTLTGASLNNLKDVSVTVPLGLLVGITGVSGSGKSSLISKTLLPALAREIGQRVRRPGPYKTLRGVEHVEKLVEISQAPIGKSPRSTPATYTGVFDLIRECFANTREAKSRGYGKGRFSFNSGAGRCSVCQGQGQERIEMNFLPDVFVTCSACNGRRYNRQTLRVKYKGATIADVLEMTVDEAASYFENFPKISRLLATLQQVGLGYVTLGQSSTTLSGGEAQRVKLATELARPEAGGIVYFLDEPTTGLHFEDVRRLVSVLNGLVDRGNSVLVIEHNLDLVATCDWIIDVGPEGGAAGGKIVATGTPEAVAANPDSLTGQYLDQLLGARSVQETPC
ncbi:MAG TPA: ABC-ATPase UvrA [Planctomycetaceae bacterium]|nr:ABC-ATPase UvrA [Planctomycetaceae bacterium]